MKTQVLNEKQINQKLDRIAYEIFENNLYNSDLLLIGIKGNGDKIAQILKEKLGAIGKVKCTIGSIDINKKNPLEQPITIDVDLKEYQNHMLILIDDVINSGKTMQYALMKLLEYPTQLIKTVALVDRKHRNYPIRCDFEGVTLSTTLQNHIEVELENEMQAFLI